MNGLDAAALFRRRRSESWRSGIAVARQVASGGGTPLILFTSLILLYQGYVRLLEWLPSGFPLVPALAAALAWQGTAVRIRTWVKPADPHLLLPAEPQMERYFREAVRYTVSVRLAWTAVVLLALFPLYTVKLGSGREFLLLAAITAVFQLLHVRGRWLEQRLSVKGDTGAVRGLLAVRAAFAFSGLLAALGKAWWAAGLAALGLAAWLRHLRRRVPPGPYPWDLLLKQEQNLTQQLTSLAGMFTDLRSARPRVRPPGPPVRRLERMLTGRDAFTYLYWRHFFRKSELFPVYRRLLLWAPGMAWIFPHPAVLLAVQLLSLWMFAAQLPALFHPERHPVWLRLYPVPETERLRAAGRISRVLLGVQAWILPLVAWAAGWLPPLHAMLLAAVGGVFAEVMTRRVVVRKERVKVDAPRG